MKMLMPFVLAFCLAVPLGYAQVNEARPGPAQEIHLLGSGSTSREGNFKWSMDVEGITGDIRCLGVEFDGTHYWVTGAFDMTIAYLYEITPQGILLNTYPQPAGNWGNWGWRDLAWDGTYLYAGDDTTKSGYITQINPATGLPTGTYYGPIPEPVTRALAYDTKTDSFWTANWGSPIYNVDRSNNVTTYLSGGTGLSTYGMAMMEIFPATPMLWLWTQDSVNGCLASEFDPVAGDFTGKTFDGDATIAGMAGGACAYDPGGWEWELCGLHQASPDSIVGYDLLPDRLSVDNKYMKSWIGGTVNLSLFAGPGHAGRWYGLFGSISGSSPGTPLPGGQILPVNWDFFTSLLVSLNLPGFIGQLDGKGMASTMMIVPYFNSTVDITMTFAYTLAKPFDFVSNPAEVFIEGGFTPPDYRYDDGSTELLIYYGKGGDYCWMHRFEVMPLGETIDSVQTIFGSAMYPGYGPPNGTPCQVFVWEDPDNDGDPSNCVLLTSESTVVQNVDTDIMNVIPLTTPVLVSGDFYVGVVLTFLPGVPSTPTDQSTTYIPGDAWFCGADTAGTFDPTNLMNNTAPPFDWGYYWCLRAGHK